jgi:antitoxin ParD1/3/4
MTIELTDELEEMVREKVRSGAYKSADEVVMASLRLLQAREEGMEAFRREILRGVEDVRGGRFSDCPTDADLESFSERVISRGQERLDATGGR